MTDPADRSPSRAVARCEAGSPAPKPLAERTKLVANLAVKAGTWAPILLAQQMGEFERENLDVEFVTPLGLADAITQVPSGGIDVIIGGAEAAWFNSNSIGIDTMWVLGANFPPDAADVSIPQTGLWVRRDTFSDPARPDLAELKGKTVASTVGPGSAIAYAIESALSPAGISLSDMTIQTMPSADMVTALQNGAVDAAWLLDPFWTLAVPDPELVLVATQSPGEPLGGVFFPPRLLDGDRAVGAAFLRAVIRTINTYLDGDFSKRPEVVQALAEATGISVETLTVTKPVVHDWEIRAGTTDRLQDTFLRLHTATYGTPISEEDLVDRSLATEIVRGS